MLSTPPTHSDERAAVASLELPGFPPPESLPAIMGDGSLFLLDSAGSEADFSRWSLLGTQPMARFTSRHGENRFHIQGSGQTHVWRAEPLSALRAALAVFPRAEALEDLPFAGAAVGIFAYELGRRLLPLHERSQDDLGLPDISLFFYDRCLVFDHAHRRMHAVAWAKGMSEDEAQREAGEKAALLAEELQARLANASAAVEQAALFAAEACEGPPDADVARAATKDADARHAAVRSSDEMAARPDPLPCRASLPAATYRAAVERCREEIRDGNAYELCLTGRFETEFHGDALALYRALKRDNPAPFASFFLHPEATLIGSSPERFLKMDPTGMVEARPIKGTRPRGANASEDRRLRDDLAASKKDRAENVMIVDLLRNDLHRVCVPGSVEVSSLCEIEDYASVFQMVSTITGRLRPDLDRCDLLASSFPGGSMTGAPKIAAMNILEELEPKVRGYYSGCQGYLGFDGSMDLSIIIRGIQLVDGRALVGAGGAVVYDSNPEDEWREALHKARAPLAALAKASGHDGFELVEE